MEHIWRLKIFGSWRRRKRENEKDKNIGRRNTFGQSRRRRTEKEKEEDIWEKESDGGQILSFYKHQYVTAPNSWNFKTSRRQ